jgi:hypothetical protein
MAQQLRESKHQTFKYNAFISYSHAADGKSAPAVQSALHQLAKPWYNYAGIACFS